VRSAPVMPGTSNSESTSISVAGRTGATDCWRFGWDFFQGNLKLEYGDVLFTCGVPGVVMTAASGVISWPVCILV
jgi:hypothetical protein